MPTSQSIACPTSRVTFISLGCVVIFSLPVEKAGRATLHLVAVHRPDSATVLVLLDGSPLVAGDGAEHIRLQSDYAPRLLNVNLKPVNLQARARELRIECVDAGVAGLYYL